MKDNFKYTEIFHSIQGEGSTVGRNTIFLRLSGCTLKCGFCDSKHSWNSNERISFDEVYSYYKSHKAIGITITGGEPLLQQDKIIQMLNKYNFGYIEIETNGTILPKNELMIMVDKWNVSPKLSNSLNRFDDRYKPEVLKKFKESPNSIFKFVIDNSVEKEVSNIIENIQIPNNKIYMMCEGETRDKQNNNQQKVIDFCLENGYNFSPRLHILIWDKKQKV